VKLQEKYGDDVTVLLVESQGHGMDDVERMILDKKWFSDHAIWTTEQPFQTGANGIPHCVVLGNDGEVLFNEYPNEGKISDLVDEQLKLAKKGPKGTPASLAKALADFEKGSYSAAIASLKAIQDGPDKDAATKLAASLTTRLNAKIAKLTWQMQNGEIAMADKAAPKLAAGVAGDQTFEAKVKELTAKLASPDMEKEREAAKALAKVQSRLEKENLDDKSTPSIVKALKAVGEKFPNTGAAKRAGRLSEVVGHKAS
jgi:hypothetical protein